jgi:type IV secretion system protein VirB9
VFAVGPDGGEALVNKTVRGNWLILARVGREWRLRHGEAVMCIRNDAFAPNGTDNPGETTSPAIERGTR